MTSSAATGRHPNRPAHVHFIVLRPGMPTVTTHLFVDDTPYIDSDVVFGVKESLIREFPRRSTTRNGPTNSVSTTPTAPCTSTSPCSRRRPEPGDPPMTAPGDFAYRALPMRVTFGVGAIDTLQTEVSRPRPQTRTRAVHTRTTGLGPDGARTALGDRGAGIFDQATHARAQSKAPTAARDAARDADADSCVVDRRRIRRSASVKRSRWNSACRSSRSPPPTPDRK